MALPAAIALDRQLFAGVDAESQGESCAEQPAPAAQRRSWRIGAVCALAVAAIVACAAIQSGGVSTKSARAQGSRVHSMHNVIVKDEEPNPALHADQTGPPCNVMAAGDGITVEEVEKCAKDASEAMKEALGDDADDITDGFDRDDHEITVRFEVALDDKEFDQEMVQESTASIQSAAAEVLGSEVSAEFKENPANFYDTDKSKLTAQVKFTSSDEEDAKKAWSACAAAEGAEDTIQAALAGGPLKDAKVSAVTCEKNPLGW